MNVYTIKAQIEAEDDCGIKEIKRLIDRDLNRGDGIYLDVDNAVIEIMRMEPDSPPTPTKQGQQAGKD